MMSKAEIAELKENSRLWIWLQKLDSNGVPKRADPIKMAKAWSHLYRTYPRRDDFNQEVHRLVRAKLLKTWEETRLGTRNHTYKTEMMQLTDRPKGWGDED